MTQVQELGLHPKVHELEDAEPVYKDRSQHIVHPPPAGVSPDFKTNGERKTILREWGSLREQRMHRAPRWCMDQLCSGSGLYPPRNLTDGWFTKEELAMIESLKRILAVTNHAEMLARDMMALRIYGIDVRIILDDSGSMQLSMFGSDERVGQGWDRRHIEQVFGSRAFSPDTLGMFQSTGCRLAAGDSRWNFLVDAVNYWEPIFEAMQLQPKYYCMNRREVFTSAREAMSMGPIGGTPSGQTLLRVLDDLERLDPQKIEPHLIICLTDGEANDAALFNNVLDSIQDEAYGDVQVLLMGLSLEPEDIKFFEDEECDDTRIRTIEAYEVEQQMILWRKVISGATDYNFAMHTVRALITNFFPGDYDYEAPIQTLRHRLYITLHALDRRVTGRRDNTYTDLRGCNCFQGLFRLFSGGRARPAFGTVDAAELELAQILCDPRFEGLMHELRPPPRKAYQRQDQWNFSSGAGTYRPRPNANQARALQSLQTAIAALQPSEMVNRDLQFASVPENAKAVRRAVQLMCDAIGDPTLVNQRQQPVGGHPLLYGANAA